MSGKSDGNDDHQQLRNQSGDYVRSTNAVAVLWAILTVCYAIVVGLACSQPYWLGNDIGDQSGVFGLFQYCTYAKSTDVNVEVCHGQLADYENILSAFFQAATALVGIAALLGMLCLACLPLFVCLSAHRVFQIIATLQSLSCLCLLVGCLVFPAGWDHPLVQTVCGDDAQKYGKGNCELRWAYVLALIGIFDALFLAVLGFTLSTRRIKQLPGSSSETVVVSSDRLTPVEGSATTNGLLVPVMDLMTHRQTLCQMNWPDGNNKPKFQL